MADPQPIAKAKLDNLVGQAAHDLIAHVVTYFHDQKMTLNEAIFVPLTIFARIARNHDAIKLLLENGHPVEAAVLTLTQFELRLDLAYTSFDVRHAREWLEHVDKRKSLRKVADKMDFIAPKGGEREILQTVFQHLSGVKHGNPLFSELGFPARMKGNVFVISTGEIDDSFTEHYGLLLSAYATYQLAWSAQVFNKFVARYAKIDKGVREKVREHYMQLKTMESVFATFLESVNVTRKGHFGFVAFKRKTIS